LKIITGIFEMFFGTHGPLSLDPRKDLGYGRNGNKNHSSRSMSGCYPYGCEDEAKTNVSMDDETVNAVQSKKIRKKSKDFYASKSVNPFYFAAGNSILECFLNPDAVIESISALGDSMVPIPRLTKGSPGGMTSASKKYYHGADVEFRSGFKAGWFSPAPESELYYDPEEDIYDEPVFNIWQLRDKVKKIRGI